jgi:ABC-type polysaccharide/polyol phosphate export permease
VAIYADLVRYRELFANLFRRDLHVKYRGSVLGIAWTLVNPLLLVGIYVLVFSLLWRARVPHYPLFVLSGLSVWILFTGSLLQASSSLVESAPLVKKIRFPRQLIPLSAVATQVVAFAVMLGILCVACFVAVPGSRDKFWLSVPLAALVVALVAGLALAVSSANVVFRDVEHVVAALLLPWFFLTPIIIPLSNLPGAVDRYHGLVQVLRYANFMTPPIEALRDPLLGHRPHVGDVVYLCVAAAVALALGAWAFRRVDDRIAVEL